MRKLVLLHGLSGNLKSTIIEEVKKKMEYFPTNLSRSAKPLFERSLDIFGPTHMVNYDGVLMDKVMHYDRIMNELLNLRERSNEDNVMDNFISEKFLLEQVGYMISHSAPGREWMSFKLPMDEVTDNCITYEEQFCEALDMKVLRIFIFNEDLNHIQSMMGGGKFNFRKSVVGGKSSEYLINQDYFQSLYTQIKPRLKNNSIVKDYTIENVKEFTENKVPEIVDLITEFYNG